MSVLAAASGAPSIATQLAGSGSSVSAKGSKPASS